MSGGHFFYKQYEIDHIAAEIEELILKNGSQEKDQWGYLKHQSYPDDIIAEFKTAVVKLRESAVYAQRIDWLVSGDDGEDCFRARLKDDLGKLSGGG
jgi:hypothetical protein